MEFTTPAGEQKYAALVRSAATSVIGLDFDGTLAPIVDDPDAALIHPEAREVLLDLAQVVAGIAVITGRPAQQALELGRLEEMGAALGGTDRELFVFGQYGNERWSSREGRIDRPDPPAGLPGFERDLPDLLRRCDAEQAFVEQKGLAVAIHTRRLDDAAGAFERILPQVRSLADQHDLTVEPGKNVVEVRGAGVHKGDAVEQLATALGVTGFLFAGDDLGDVEAFEALVRLQEQGLHALRVSSDPAIGSPLRAMVDLVVDGPDGVLALLRRFVDDVRAVDA